MTAQHSDIYRKEFLQALDEKCKECTAIMKGEIVPEKFMGNDFYSKRFKFFNEMKEQALKKTK